jgi:hypothetical protein
VSVPVIGCETGGQVTMPVPKTSVAFVPIRSAIAAKLAFYKSANGLGLLAPRGWHCYGTVGSGGSQLFVTPEPVNLREYFSNAWPGFQGQVVQLVRRLGDTPGRFNVAEVIMRVFPERRSFAESVRVGFPGTNLPVGPYPADKWRCWSDLRQTSCSPQ